MASMFLHASFLMSIGLSESIPPPPGITDMRFGIKIKALDDIQAKAGQVVLTVWFRTFWKDERIKAPKNDVVRYHPSEIWIPELTVWEGLEEPSCSEYEVRVDDQGNVQAIPGLQCKD